MMFTAARTTLGKLRALESELADRYAEALRRRRFQEASAIFARRRAAHRAVLVVEEWGGEFPAADARVTVRAA